HLTAPSAVHLTTCFSPDSQQHGFSVQASSPLSPPQRFGVFELSILYHDTTFTVNHQLQIFQKIATRRFSQENSAIKHKNPPAADSAAGGL
ncbi:MAG: hypothetical protein UC390_06610, partial [Peptococcaceae bacterium]|nr:hypothetical protein [Peptococcaceae bacterium]